MRTLKLSIDTLTVELGNGYDSSFTSYEKTIAETGSVEYSLYGTALEEGSLYEPKYVWTIGVYLSLTQWQNLQVIYQRCERKRRTQASYNIVLEDFISPYVEDVTSRTRALATGASVTTIGSVAISYPAQFNVRLFEPKAIEGNNRNFKYLVTFVLKELDTVTA